ncbi:hypothetical protein DMA11_04820 [Marinilabiliaceae bacterium JC017]|nr:hypothetical protein DMA11_04820 [Marinilabiliaceae bacterium JC017]
MKNSIVLLVVALFVYGCNLDQSKTSYLEGVKGPYLGQSLPGTEPVLFAPGIVNTGKFTRDLTMTPEGDEIYYSVCGPGFRFCTIMVTKKEGERWIKPEVAFFARDPKFKYIEPFIAPDGKHLFYVSNQSVTGDSIPKDYDIWVLDRTDNGWSAPRNLGAPVNTAGDEFFPSLTKDGTIYYTSETEGAEGVILCSRWNGEAFATPDSLPRQVNCGQARYNALISPDEDFLIQGVWGMADTRGGTDYYIIFRNEKDEWSLPVNMGDQMNTTEGHEYAATLSPDSKYIFFMSDRNNPDLFEPGASLTAERINKAYQTPGNGMPSIYWMNASFITALKAKVQWEEPRLQ